VPFAHDLVFPEEPLSGDATGLPDPDEAATVFDDEKNSR
jgi:hypothetical protein